MISVNEVANRLGVSYDTITDLCRAGLLQSFKVNRRRLISVASFEAFVAIKLREQAALSSPSSQ
jgi:excisionase family DNA binding protein